jgi:IS30 family transposase
MISKQQYETQLQQIFRLLLQNKTQEEIAHELNISTRTVARYCQRIDQRYGQIQAQKTDNTLFTEVQLFKNRLLKMYRILEQKALDPKTSGTETAKCCEVAASLAIDVLRLEAETIKVVKNGLVSIGEAAVRTANKNALNNLRNDNDDDTINNNYHQEQEEQENDNRKF